MIASGEAFFCAVIYIWILNLPSHPLHGIVYIGQTMRAGMTHEAAFKKRTSNHVSDSARLDKGKEWGLHSLIRSLGIDAFKVEILEMKTGPKAECMAWMNVREIALIREHGGPMKSLDRMPEGGQTLNLTHGGTGATCASIETWIAILDRRSQRLFEKFVKFLKLWRQANPDKILSPPMDAVLPDPDDPTAIFPLGQIVRNVRHINSYNARGDASRKMILDDMGFRWGRSNSSEQEALDQFIDFVRANGHGDVPQHYKTSSGYPLGRQVHHIRGGSFRISSTPSKKQLWECVGFDFDPKQPIFLEILHTLHSDPKPPRESKFGNHVKNMRSSGAYLKNRPDRIKLVHKTGLKLHTQSKTKNEERWDEVLRTGTCSAWEETAKKERKRKRSVE